MYSGAIKSACDVITEVSHALVPKARPLDSIQSLAHFVNKHGQEPPTFMD